LPQLDFIEIENIGIDLRQLLLGKFLSGLSGKVNETDHKNVHTYCVRVVCALRTRETPRKALKVTTPFR